MRRIILSMLLAVSLSQCVQNARAQDAEPAAGDSGMTKLLPMVGMGVANHTLYDASGNPLSTNSFSGRYTVLVFGCLT